MKILHLIYDHIGNPWVGGGGAVRAYEIYRRLAQRHDVTVVCGKYPAASDHREGNLAFRFVGTASDNYVLSTFCYALKAADYVKTAAGDYDVVVEDFAPYNPVFSFRRRRDAVVQLHQREGLRHLKKYALLGVPFFLIEKYYPRLFRNAVVISELSRDAFGLGGRAAIIPNGFEKAVLEQETEDGGYILFLGRLHIGQKGLDTLCKALRLVDCRLVIAGGGKDESRVISLFSSAVAAGRAEFTGFVGGPRKFDLLRKCLLLVMPSRYEGQPLTMIEAAACGKPVIVSDIPELKYAVDAGFALSFRTGDARDLAAKMNILLGNASLRHEMGNKARGYARNFTWDRIAEEYEKFLTGIVHRRGGA